MEKRAIIIIGIILLLFLVSFAFAQTNNENKDSEELQSNQIEPISKEIEEEKISPKEAFLKYLQEKINELPDEEKEKFKKYQNMEPAEAFLKAIEKFQSQAQEEETTVE